VKVQYGIWRGQMMRHGGLTHDEPVTSWPRLILYCTLKLITLTLCGSRIFYLQQQALTMMELV